jgi:hypothetical protein
MFDYWRINHVVLTGTGTSRLGWLGWGLWAIPPALLNSENMWFTMINHWIIWGIALLMGYKPLDLGYSYSWMGETKPKKITKKKAFLYQSHQNIPNPSPNPSGNNYNFTWLKEA